MAKEVLDEFPDLRGEGFTETDITIVNRFYCNEVTSQLLNNSDDIFVHLKHVGYFATDNQKIKRYAKSLRQSLDNSLKIPQEILLPSVNRKLSNVENLVQTKKKYTEEKLAVVNSHEENRTTLYNRGVFTRQLTYYNEFLKYIHDTQTIARHMEK